MTQELSDNLFILLNIDPEIEWSFEGFTKEVTKKKNSYSNIAGSPVPKKTEYKDKLDKVKSIGEITESLFRMHWDQAKRIKADSKEEEEKQFRQLFLTKLKARTFQGYLTSDQLEELYAESDPLNLSVEIGEHLHDEKIEIIDINSQFGQSLQSEDETKLQNLDNALVIVGKPDLYAALNLTHEASLEDLVKNAHQLYSQHPGSSTRDASFQSISGLAKTFFESHETKRKYDNHVKRARIKAAWSELDNRVPYLPKEVYSHSEQSLEIISGDQSQALFDITKQILGTTPLSDIEILESIKSYAWLKYRIYVVKPREKAVKTSQAVPTPFIDERKNLKNEAERLFNQHQYDSALNKIQEALRCHPKAKDILARECRELQKDIEIAKDKRDNARDAFTTAYRAKRLTEAQTALNQWRQYTPAGDQQIVESQANLAKTRKQYQNHLEAAANAQKHGYHKSAIEHYSKALDVCVDDESIYQKRDDAIEYLYNVASYQEIENPSNTYNQLEELSATLKLYHIPIPHFITATLKRLKDEKDLRRQILIDEIEMLLKSKNIYAAGLRIDASPDIFQNHPVHKKVREIKAATATMLRDFQREFTNGSYYQSLQELTAYRNQYIIDDPDLNNYIDNYERLVLEQLQKLQRSKEWHTLQEYGRKALEDLSQLKLFEYKREIQDLVSDAIENQRRLNEAMIQTQQAISQKNFYEAQESLITWGLFSAADDPHLKENRLKVAQTIKWANDLYVQASQLEDHLGPEAAQIYHKILTNCADHPGAVQRLGDLPPAPPTNFSLVLLQPGKIQFQWDPVNNSSKTKYCVYERAAFVGETSNTSMIFSNYENGRRYYFSVVAIQKGVKSTPTNEIVFTEKRDITKLKVQHEKEKVLLSWDLPDNVSRILIKHAHTGKQLHSYSGENLSCELPTSELGNEDWVIICRYDHNDGSQETSNGVYFSLSDTKINDTHPTHHDHASVDDLHVRLCKDRLICYWRWISAVRTATIETVVKKPDGAVEYNSDDVSAFVNDYTSTYSLNLKSALEPMSDVIVTVSTPDSTHKHSFEFTIPDYSFSYKFLVKQRLFKAKEYIAVISAHNLTKPVSLIVELHESELPVKIPSAKTCVETIPLAFTPNNTAIRAKIQKKNIGRTYLRIFEADTNAAAQLDLIDQTLLSDQDTYLP